MDQRKTILISGGLLLFCASAALSYLITQVQEMEIPQQEQWTAASMDPAAPKKFVWLEQYTVCALYELDCEPEQIEGDAGAEKEIADLELAEIAARYPLPDWSVASDDQTVTMTKNLPGMCSNHKQIYHLGVNESGEYLTVFYGPAQVGAAGGAYLITDTSWSKLSQEEREKILAGSYQFQEQEDLIAILDSFSEI